MLARILNTPPFVFWWSPLTELASVKVPLHNDVELNWLPGPTGRKIWVLLATQMARARMHGGRSDKARRQDVRAYKVDGLAEDEKGLSKSEAGQNLHLQLKARAKRLPASQDEVLTLVASSKSI